MTASAETPKKKHSLMDTVRSLREPRVAQMFALGFSSGLPFLLTGATFGYWLRDEGTTLTAIGFLSWVGLAYTFKFLWAPVVDRMPAPLLSAFGQRRGWGMLMMLTIAAALVGMAIVGPHGPGGLATIGLLALVVALGSATQDTALDAWRIESARDPEELGVLTSSFTLGFRVALLITDAVILILAQHLGWSLSYVLMAVLMGVGLFTALQTPEPARVEPTPAQRQETAAAEITVVPQRRLMIGGVLFLLSAVAMYVLCSGDFFAGQTDLAHPSLFGIVFAAALFVAGVCCFARQAFIGWAIGAAAVIIIIAIAFWSALMSVDVIHAPHIFYPVAGAFIAAALIAPPKIYNAVVGPFIQFFHAHGPLAAVMLLMISLYRLPEFVIGPVAGPFYHDLGLSKDTVGAVRGTIGLIASFVGIAVGGVCVLRLGYLRSLIVGAVLQGLGVAGYALLGFYGANLTLFASVMSWDNFCYAFAGVALVTYMSSLTSAGFTATQYALMSSMFTAVGKVLKGFSGAVVDGLSQSHTLMQSYSIFYIGAGAICLPALALCLYLAARNRTPADPTPAPA